VERASSRPVPTIAGPTAVGKTELSLKLAERLLPDESPAEIISADSRQVYRDLDIGTAKPSAEAQERVPHHFIDEKDLDEDFSAGAFAEEAHARIDAIRERGCEALVVGGSTLYLHALQVGLADIPDVPSGVRERLGERLEREGADALFAELQDVDPDRAARLDATKTHQVIRALEVHEHTGRTLTHFHEHQPEPPHDFSTVVLQRDRPLLYDRINRRVDRMLQSGLVDEVRALRKRGADRHRPPLRTIGYREVFDFLDGEHDRAEMERLIKRNTRRYAKRQLSWFRRYDDYTWTHAETPVEEVLGILTPESPCGV
jgi:tRNA dimethylallyltransferase